MATLLTYRTSLTPALPTSTTVKSSPLSNNEIDANFKTLDNELALKETVVNVALKETSTNKDAMSGYVGLTAYKVNMKNVGGTVTSWMTNSATTQRTWTMPDKDGTVAMLVDITGTNSGTNTGDETLASIKSKLGITTLSGSNTGDQTSVTGSSGSCTGNAATSSACTGNSATASNLTGAPVITVDDITTRRAGTPTTGYVFFGNTGTKYVGFDGTNVVSNGNTYVSGTFTASSTITANSDERLKQNWQSFNYDFIDRLSEVKSGIYDRIDIQATQVGVSAQSLRQVIPQAVLEGNDGMLSVAYGNAALTACIELAKEVVLLRAEINKLKGI